MKRQTYEGTLDRYITLSANVANVKSAKQGKVSLCVLHILHFEYKSILDKILSHKIGVPSYANTSDVA